MKKLFLILTICLLPIVVSAQTVEVVEINILDDNPSGLSAVFAGVVYSDNGVALKTGGITKLWGGLYSMTHMNAGTSGSLDEDIAYFVHLPVLGINLNVGLLAGPNADWINAPDGQPAIMYLVGATGGVLAADITDKIGLWGIGKYKFSFRSDEYDDGITAGGGVYLRF